MPVRDQCNCPVKLIHGEILLPHIIWSSHHVLHIIPAKPWKAEKSLHYEEVLFKLGANLISAIHSKYYPIGTLTVLKWSLHPSLSLGPPPLFFSLSFKAKHMPSMPLVWIWCLIGCLLPAAATSIPKELHHLLASMKPSCKRLEQVLGYTVPSQCVRMSFGWVGVEWLYFVCCQRESG